MKYLLTIVLILLFFPVMAQRHDWTLVGRDWVTNRGYVADSVPISSYAVVGDILPYQNDTTFGAYVYDSAGLNFSLLAIVPISISGKIGPIVRSFVPDTILAFSNSNSGSLLWRQRNLSVDSIVSFVKTIIPTSNIDFLKLVIENRNRLTGLVTKKHELMYRGACKDALIGNRYYFAILQNDSGGPGGHNRLFYRYDITSNSEFRRRFEIQEIFGYLDSTRYAYDHTLSPGVNLNSLIVTTRYARPVVTGIRSIDSLHIAETDFNHNATGKIAKYKSLLSSDNSILDFSIGRRRSGTTQNIPLTHYFGRRYLLGRYVRSAPDSSVISVLNSDLSLQKDIKIPGCIVFVRPLHNKNVFVTYSIKKRGVALRTTDSLFFASVFDTLGNEIFKHQIFEVDWFRIGSKFGVTNYPVSYTEDGKGGLFILCWQRTATLVHLSNIGKFYHDTVRTGPVVSLASNISSGTFKYYPNPADNTLTITSSAEAPETALIIDMLGRKVAEYPLKHDRSIVDISAIPQGVYRLRIGREAKTLVVKH